ncbi:hypothetical protein TPY_0033 [Sulfobacillus acidophilus TPY]|uniref:Uncharacterized protein n=1 Tax=Sulfobacillus acidophilus (strain ATCC 700253 / DSM 10332 / NAL) TaxID=679936 RepID=G8TV27_SULAD|nr:hypothetical protein TPY_0033 [Sulfobacillus acidophilus TPY]AEW03608.1 hypothetical protein Sulac_0032 [Sulfobacillus acidophilus DSM 10332]
MAGRIPEVHSLEAAVQAVIRQNIACGYRPVRFIQKTQKGNAPTDDLITNLTNLVRNNTAQAVVSEAIQRYPKLLTIEDFLQYDDWALAWGFSCSVADQARLAVRRYDRQAGHVRWERAH